MLDGWKLERIVIRKQNFHIIKEVIVPNLYNLVILMNEKYQEIIGRVFEYGGKYYGYYVDGSGPIDLMDLGISQEDLHIEVLKVNELITRSNR